MTRGIKLSKTFKNYIYDQAYNWPVGKKSTDFSEDAFITNVYVTDDKIHNLNLLGKFFKNDDEEDAYAERHYVNIGNGTCSSSFCDMISLHVVKSDKNILGDHKIPKDHILVIGRQYYSRGMPAMLAMEAPFDDYLAYIEDDLGVEPSDKPSEKIYKGYEE